MKAKSKKKPVWRKSDQTNADLPVGRTWIDYAGSLIELMVAYENWPGSRDKVWIAYPVGTAADCIISEGPGAVVRKWDEKVSYARQMAGFEPNS